MSDQLFALLCCVGDAVFVDCFLIVPDFFKITRDLFRNLGSAHLSESHDLIVTRDRHDARDYGHADSSFAHRAFEGEEISVVEEELCNNKVGSSLHFPTEVIPIRLLV